MPSCDLCGKESNLVQAIVEGSLLSVCNNCSKFGNVVQVDKPAVQKRETRRTIAQAMPSRTLAENIETVVQDYSMRIRKAREIKDLTQEKLGQAIAEKESLIHKLESGQMRPSIKLARKLQQFLGVELLTKELEEDYDGPLNLKEEGLTIGDLIKRKASNEQEKEPKLV
jgi:putative transcription factor